MVRRCSWRVIVPPPSQGHFRSILAKNCYSFVTGRSFPTLWFRDQRVRQAADILCIHVFLDFCTMSLEGEGPVNHAMLADFQAVDLEGRIVTRDTVLRLAPVLIVLLRGLA